MYEMGCIHSARKEYQQAVEWFTKGAEAGLPKAMCNLGTFLDQGKGVAAPDCPAAAGWYRRAADSGIGVAAKNLSTLYTLGRGWAWQIKHAT
jgi:TPR repeat protein